MATFDLAIPGLLLREGGLVDSPTDRGGLTNFGISLRAYPDLGRAGIENLSPERATAIYLVDYWTPLRLAKVADELVATAIFDFAVHSGIRRATIEAQRIAGVRDDGAFGPKTLAAVNAAEPDLFLARYTLARVFYWVALARNVVYRPNLRGWLNRLAELDAELRSRRASENPTGQDGTT